MTFFSWVFLPLFVIASFNPFVPSHVWLQIIEPYVTILAAPLSFFSSAIMFSHMRTGVREKGWGKLLSVVLKFLLLVFVAFMIFFATVDLVRRGIPSLITLAWGDRVEHTFVIADVREGDAKGCRRPIHLRDMPIMTRFCNLPSELLDQLHPGMAVIFIGKGTWMGLFVEDFRKP